ncbi:DUF2905 domain-containing protein [Alkaliphilus crotonatoxidans]
MNSMGRLLMMGGIILIIVGGIVTLAGRLGLGRLPGDILLKRGNVTFYFPIVTSILISLLLTLILNLIFRR